MLNAVVIRRRVSGSAQIARQNSCRYRVKCRFTLWTVPIYALRLLCTSQFLLNCLNNFGVSDSFLTGSSCWSGMSWWNSFFLYVVLIYGVFNGLTLVTFEVQYLGSSLMKGNCSRCFRFFSLVDLRLNLFSLIVTVIRTFLILLCCEIYLYWALRIHSFSSGDWTSSLPPPPPIKLIHFYLLGLQTCENINVTVYFRIFYISFNGRLRYWISL